MAASRRSLSRIKKDVVFLRQLGQCAYCLAPMDDAFEVDHMNECCEDDRWANLVASCGTCHNTKSRAYRLRARDPAKAALLRRMLEEAAQHRAELLREYLLCVDHPSESPLTPRLPAWLRARVPAAALHLMDALCGSSTGEAPEPPARARAEPVPAPPPVRSKYFA